MKRGTAIEAGWLMRRLIFPPLLIAAIALAQQDASTPTFRAGTKLVEVEVVARSKNLPATGLTKDDFTLIDNGKKQLIAFFSFQSRKVGGAAASAPLPPGTFSNRVAGASGAEAASRTIILLDQMNTPAPLQIYAIARIGKFLQTRRATDRTAIYTLTGNGGLHVVQELTADSDLLKRAADSLKGRDRFRPDSDTTGMTQHQAEGLESVAAVGPALAVEGALQQIARHVANVPGRKTVVWITTAAFPLYSIDLGLDFRREMTRAAQALNDANAALYAVDARGLIGALEGLTPVSAAASPGPPGSSAAVIGLMQRAGPITPRGLDVEQWLSDLTGGLTFFDKSNAIEESIQTAVDDGQQTYTLGFYPEQTEQGGTVHDLKVAVLRRGVSLRYRRNYLAGTDGDVSDGRPALKQLLAASLDATQLELRVSTAPDPAHAQNLQVSVNIDLHNVEFRRENNQHLGALDLTFYVEGTGRALTKPLQIGIPDAQFASFLENGLDADATIDTTGGVEAFRVIVQDKTTGAAGSVTIPLKSR